MDVPKTVTAALDDRPIDGAICLDAGAGVGNTTAGLLASGAARVYAVTNDREHARTTVDRVRERLRTEERLRDEGGDRLAVLEADLRELPLPDDSIDVVTAHGLFNVVPPADLGAIVEELTRVARRGGHLVVDDYEPLPDDAAVRDLFAAENAAAELAAGRPMLSFYPSDVLRRLCEGYGWAFDRRLTLLAPVPWTGAHLEAHAAVVRSNASELPPELGDPLIARAERLAESIGEESVGEMYSLAMALE
ncbi:class I SAM-dependent methyltransferase [Halosolutus gelatinilyticus]|uniref:class I SAM-dependent methyltransferase n=1 Tax=Halosolutus gelatinilyticus TaxID=2931975 RepID=UPI001FF60778|nr:class I SAM-dependent methyltransferase [Halosolutus gelatinilyticus]